MKVEQDHGSGPERLGLLASAIAGRALQVAPSRPGEATWTDGRVVFVDLELAPRAQVASLVVQASLLAAGSLEPELVRRLKHRPALARRYLAVEGHRALAAIEDLLPTSLRPLIDAEVAARSDSPAASLSAARSREQIADPPRSFGALRPRRLLASIAGAEGSQQAATQLPGERRAQVLAELAEDAEYADDDAADLLGNPGGGGGRLGEWLGRLLSVARRLEGGGPPGIDAPTHTTRVPMQGGAPSTFSAGRAASLDGEDGAVPDRETRYPEWDAGRRRYRRRWCTVREIEARVKDGEPLPVSDRYGLRRPLARLGMGLDSCHRQPQGDDIDIDAAIEARVELIAGSPPDEAIYVDSLRQRRDLSVLFLLDISGSTGERSATGRTVHEIQRAVAAALVDVLHRIGDRVALYAFQSQGRSAVNLVPVKRFDEELDAIVMRRLHGLEPGAFSRLGAAIRHGTAVLRDRGATSRRLLVVLSDGLAYDHGYEPAYGAADARRALAEARLEGIGCLCLTIGAATDTDALRRVFGSAAHATIPKPAQLGQAIGPLFRSALRSAELRRRVA